MPVYNPLEIPNGTLKYQYVNPDIPSGNTISSTLVASPKTAFTSRATIPESTATIGGIASIVGRGVLSTGITALNLTITVEMAGQVVATATQMASVNLSNQGWSMEIQAIILGNGTVEVQGMCIITSNPMPIRNTVTYTMSTSGGVPVTISVQYGTLALGGSITLRQFILQVF